MRLNNWWALFIFLLNPSLSAWAWLLSFSIFFPSLVCRRAQAVRRRTRKVPTNPWSGDRTLKNKFPKNFSLFWEITSLHFFPLLSAKSRDRSYVVLLHRGAIVPTELRLVGCLFLSSFTSWTFYFCPVYLSVYLFDFLCIYNKMLDLSNGSHMHNQMVTIPNLVYIF